MTTEYYIFKQEYMEGVGNLLPLLNTNEIKQICSVTLQIRRFDESNYNVQLHVQRCVFKVDPQKARKILYQERDQKDYIL